MARMPVMLSDQNQMKKKRNKAISMCGVKTDTDEPLRLLRPVIHAQRDSFCRYSINMIASPVIDALYA